LSRAPGAFSQSRVGRNLLGIASLFGVDLKAFVRAWPQLIWYWRQKKAFEAHYRNSSDQTFVVGSLRPCLTDRHAQGGTASGMYFYQDLVVAQMIFKARPARHVDVGSRVDGFVAHVATFCEVEVLDIRPITTRAENIRFRQADLMNMSSELDGFARSLSSLNALEHFGLGRYGDPIDSDGHRKGFANLARMLAPGGTLYFAVPISIRQRYEFNAHRLFTVPYLLDLFQEFALDVVTFHYVDDAGELVSELDHTSPAARRSFGLNFGCGIFELKKSRT
jgi:SAM-dependent methyltransferase